MPSTDQLWAEFKRAVMYMQLPIVGFLAIASFQTQRTQKKGGFALAGYGWLFNLGYIGLSSTLEFINAATPNRTAATSFEVEAIAHFLDAGTAACFMLAYLIGNDKRSTAGKWFRKEVVVVILLTIGSSLSNLIALKQVAQPAGFIALSAPLVIFSLAARLSLGKALFEATKADVRIAQGPNQLYVACFIYAIIQPLYLLRPIVAQSQTVGFFVGFIAKMGIAYGFVILFSALSSKYATEQGALNTARTILGRIRHELNTPLGELRNWIDATMSEAPVHGKLRQGLQNMESATERALAITDVRDDVLYDVVSKSALPIEETTQATREIVNINTLVQTAIIAVKTTRSEDVRWDVSFAAGNCIRCSREQIIQIFVNLLRNACDALRDAGGRIAVKTIQVKPERDEGPDVGRFVQVIIRDNGEGFHESIREAAFNGGFTTRQGRDRGHGLAIVKRLVALNDGSIEVMSPVRANDKERPGTEMTVTFPKVRCHDGDSNSTNRL